MALGLGDRVVSRKRRTRRSPQDTNFHVRPYLEHCGQEVRAARKAAGLRAHEVGEVVGLTASPITHFECGTGIVHLEKLLHIFHVVALPIPHPFVPRVPAELADFAELYTRATPQMQEAVRLALIAADPYRLRLDMHGCAIGPPDGP